MRIFITRNGSRTTPARLAPLLALTATALLGSQAPAVRADEPLPGYVTSHARYIAVTVCGTCHGRDGNSVFPKFPRLAGQQPGYVAAQLKAFRAQTRGDSDAIAYMWGMSAQLDDGTIEALATWYASQPALPESKADPALVAQGREIYLKGIPAQGVPACVTCHGADAHGTAEFPRLAGQHATYILKQLGAFQSNMRNVAIMHGVAMNLQRPEMQAVAAYLEVQH